MAAATYKAISSSPGMRPDREPQPSSATEFILDTRKPVAPGVMPLSESTGRKTKHLLSLTLSLSFILKAKVIS